VSKEQVIDKCIESLFSMELKGVFGGEATQISPKLGKLLSRLFPDTSTPLFLKIKVNIRNHLHAQELCQTRPNILFTACLFVNYENNP